MNKSPTKRTCDSAGFYCSSEFDYQEDFTQFLEKARKSSCKWSSNTEHLQAAGKQQLDGERKSRKSWKNSFFSWLLKTDKRSKSAVSKTRCGHVPGPVKGSYGGDIAAGRTWRSALGPLVRLFSSTGGANEYEAPYLCLGQLNNTQEELRSYGPVYLVT